jgi:hypothetical protein
LLFFSKKPKGHSLSHSHTLGEDEEREKNLERERYRKMWQREEIYERNKRKQWERFDKVKVRLLLGLYRPYSQFVGVTHSFPTIHDNNHPRNYMPLVGFGFHSMLCQSYRHF